MQEEKTNTNNQQPIYVQQPPTTVLIQNNSNGLGTAGFVLAIIYLFTCRIPVVSFVIWSLGALFSFIGMFKSPRGLAIAGFIISIIVFIFIFMAAMMGVTALGALMSLLKHAVAY